MVWIGDRAFLEAKTENDVTGLQFGDDARLGVEISRIEHQGSFAGLPFGDVAAADFGLAFLAVGFKRLPRETSPPVRPKRGFGEAGIMLHDSVRRFLADHFVDEIDDFRFADSTRPFHSMALPSRRVLLTSE